MRRHSKHPEFVNLEKIVWEGLNNIGRTIPQIEKQEDKTIKINPKQKSSINDPIWHTKPELDQYVAKELGLVLKDYGDNTKTNALYNAVVSEVRRLRKCNILIDWHLTESKKRGMGLWRLDKTKLEKFVHRRADQEMRESNFYSDGKTSMIFVRQKQVAFRKKLLGEYGKCALCGFKLPDYMIGAHIVPYSVMRREDAANAMNPANGLLLCRLCDVAFEKGSITLESDLGITISDYLADQRSPAVRSWLGPIPAELRIKADAKYPPDPIYLKWKKKLLASVCLN